MASNRGKLKQGEREQSRSTGMGEQHQAVYPAPGLLLAHTTRFFVTRSSGKLIEKVDTRPQATTAKEHAHELIERMAPGQVSAVVGLLEIMLDPFARALANAPYDDEPISEQEDCEIEAAHASLARREGVSHEEILAEYGLTLEDFDRMGRTPLESNGAAQ